MTGWPAPEGPAARAGRKTHAKETQMGKHGPDRQDLATYEAPVLTPARVQYGSQGRSTPLASSNIVCCHCSIGE